MKDKRIRDSTIFAFIWQLDNDIYDENKLLTKLSECSSKQQDGKNPIARQPVLTTIHQEFE